LLVLVQAGVLRRVVFDGTYKGFVGIIPPKPTPKWLTTSEFTVPFGHWRRELEKRRDVFLGYCSASKIVARQVIDLLKSLGYSVLDWAADFDPANTILTRIEEAAGHCGAGIFLFTKDDEFSSKEGESRAAPRDNVVFEAGYFIAHKDKPRESGAKMPADLGGDIYASFDSRDSVASEIEPTVRRFLDSL
jgi:predicted nucleotide-binding protein